MRLFGYTQLGLIFTILTSALNAQNCAKPVTRKEIRELTQAEFKNYTLAIQKLHATKAAGLTISKFEQFSKLHDAASKSVHNNPVFLPWHREFLFQYEKALKEINPKVILPYWDWTLDYEYPHESAVLSKYMMGGNGDETNNNCVGDGPFNKFIMKYPPSKPAHCLTRQYDDEKNVTAFINPETIIAISNDKRFSYFSKPLEIYHGYPHIGIGGGPGDFSSMYSPNDPLFYLHHCFIDMVFSKWQDKHGLNIPYEGAKYKKGVKDTDTLFSYPIKVSDTWNTRSKRYCYQYPNYPRIIPNPKYIPTTKPALNTNELPEVKGQTKSKVKGKVKGKGEDKEINVFEIPDKMFKTFSKGVTGVLEGIDESSKQIIGGLLQNNPFLSGDGNNEFIGKDLKSLTSLLKLKHKGKGTDKAKKRRRKPKILPLNWILKNGFTLADVEEIFNSTLELLNVFDEIGFMSIGDIHLF